MTTRPATIRRRRPLAPNRELIRSVIDRARQLLDEADAVVSAQGPNWSGVSASVLRRAESGATAARLVLSTETGVPLPADELNSRAVAAALQDLVELLRGTS